MKKKIGCGYVRERETLTGVSYQVAAYEGKDLQGKNVYRYATAKTREEAETMLEKMSAEIILGKKNIHGGGSKSLQNFIEDEFLKYYAVKNKPTTVKSYTYLAKYVCASPLAKKSLRSIGTSNLQAFFNGLYQKSTLSNDPLSGRTIGDIRRFVHLVYEQAIACGYVETNPCSGTKLRRQSGGVKDRDEEVYDEEEIRKLLAAAKGTDMECILLLFLEVGLRRGEAVALRYDDFDPNTGKITIQRNAVEDKDGNVLLTDPKTMSSVRTVKLSSYCQEKIKESHLSYKKLRLRKGKDFVDSGCILHGKNGEMMTPHSLYNKWVRFERKHGLRHIKLHGLRKTSATSMIVQGMDAKSVANRLGHKNCDITLKIYTAVTEEMKEKNAEKMDQFFAKLVNE